MYFCREQHRVRSLSGRFGRAIYDQALRYDIGDRVTIDEAYVDSEARLTEGGSPDDVLARRLTSAYRISMATRSTRARTPDDMPRCLFETAMSQAPLLRTTSHISHACCSDTDSEKSVLYDTRRDASINGTRRPDSHQGFSADSLSWSGHSASLPITASVCRRTFSSLRA